MDSRPIDLASIAFDSFQKIVFPQFMDYVNQIAWIAYRIKGVSCIDAVFDIIHDIVSHLNKKLTTKHQKYFALMFF